MLEEWAGKELPENKTRFGYIIGSNEFTVSSVEKIKERKKDRISIKSKERKHDFVPAVEIIKEFESREGVKLTDIDTGTFEGKELRSELLVLLKDRGGLKYREIMEYPIFKELKYSSLGK